MPEGFFNSAAAGYSNVQQQLQALGGLRGSFAPNDGMGAAYQVSTPPAPRFNTYTSTAAFPVTPIGSPPAPLPSYGTAFNTGGGGQGYTPSAPRFPTPVMPPMFSYGPPPIPYGSMPTSQAYPSYGMASMMSDMAVGGGFSTPGIGASIHRTQSEARRRLVSGGFDMLGTMGNVASWGFGLAGMALGGVGGLGLGVIGAGLGIAHGAYTNVRAQTASTRELFSNITSGGLLSPSGYGINNATAMQINSALSNSAKGMGFGGDTSIRQGLLTSTMQQAQEMGMLKGSTGSVGQIVSRVTELAKVTEGIMALGESITQGDAMQLQAMTQQMGISTQKFKQLRIGDKLVSAARLAGTTIDVAMQAAGQGASTFTQLGLNAGQGMTTGAYSMGAAASLVGSGYLSQSQLARLGGESGIQQQILGGQAAYRARRAQEMLFGALDFSAGGFSVDADLVRGNVAGFRTGKEMRQRGIDFFNDKRLSKKQRAKLRAIYDENVDDLSTEVQDNISEMDIVSMQSRDILGLMQKRGMSRMQAATTVLGSKEAATVFLAQADSGNMVGDQARQRRVSEYEVGSRALNQFNSTQVGYFEALGTRAYNYVSSPFRAAGEYAAKQSLMYEDYLAAGRQKFANVQNYSNVGDFRANEAILRDATGLSPFSRRRTEAGLAGKIADINTLQLASLVGGSDAYKAYFGTAGGIGVTKEMASGARSLKREAWSLVDTQSIRDYSTRLGDSVISQAGALADVATAFGSTSGTKHINSVIQNAIGDLQGQLGIVKDMHGSAPEFLKNASLKGVGAVALDAKIAEKIQLLTPENRKAAFGTADVASIMQSAAGRRMRSAALAMYKTKADKSGTGNLVTAALAAENELTSVMAGLAGESAGPQEGLSDISLEAIDTLKSLGLRADEYEIAAAFGTGSGQGMLAEKFKNNHALRIRAAAIEKKARDRGIDLHDLMGRVVKDGKDQFAEYVKGDSKVKVEELFKSAKLTEMFNTGLSELGVKNTDTLYSLFKSTDAKEVVGSIRKFSGRGHSSANILTKGFGIDLTKLDAESAEAITSAIADVNRSGDTASVDNLKNQIFKVIKAKAAAGSGANADETAAQKAMDDLAQARKDELKAMAQLMGEMRNLLAEVQIARGKNPNMSQPEGPN